VNFPRHNITMYLIHNEHKSYCEPLDKYSESWQFTWVNEEQKKLALEKDDVWTIQWYPDTPVGFYALAAHSLEILLKAACNESFR